MMRKGWNDAMSMIFSSVLENSLKIMAMFEIDTPKPSSKELKSFLWDNTPFFNDSRFSLFF